LRRVLAQKQPVLGICLGSQLLAAQKTASKRLWSSQVKRA
jgi:imidazoleglycerol phosphate synthase glutamine amidotransferase subunit HisH